MIRVDQRALARLTWAARPNGGTVWARWDDHLVHMEAMGIIMIGEQRFIQRKAQVTVTRFGRQVLGYEVPRGKVRLTCREFRDLPEYSASLPTGTTTGKRWKRQQRDQSWSVGEFGRAYETVDSAGRTREMIVIEWYDIVLRPTHAELPLFEPVKKRRLRVPGGR